MRRFMRTVSALAGVALLAGSLAACDEKDATATPSQSQEETQPAEPTASEPQETATDEPEVDGQGSMWNGEGEDPATMEDTTWNGEGEDPATMQDEDPQHDPNATVVDYETLPGPCPNDVPLPEVKHSVVAGSSDNQGECVLTVDARGDSLFMAKDIASQLDALGFEQTSISEEDTSETALNMVSYLTNTHEVHVTVQQDGISGVIITYALTKKLRGNG